MGRRTETTEMLKEYMADALIELMADRPIDKIGFKEITDKAGVGRITFYRYFNAKTDLILYKTNILWARWIALHPENPNTDNVTGSKWFFSFFYENKDLIMLLYRHNMLSLIYDFILRIMSPLGRYIHDNHFIISFLTYGFLGIIIEWAKNDFKESTEEMLDLFENLNNTSIIIKEVDQ